MNSILIRKARLGAVSKTGNRTRTNDLIRHASASRAIYHANTKNSSSSSARLFIGVRFQSSSSSLELKRAGNTQVTSSDGVAAVPIDFDVSSRIEGQESQIVTVDLEPGNVLRAESGAMLYMTEGIEIETTTGGGLSAGFKRMLTGQNLMISDFRYGGAEGTTGQVALGTDFPSKIVRLSVEDYGGKIVCQKGALLCASHTIDIQMEFAKKMTAGFFGGEGFVLQALTGTGDVFVKAGGTLIRRVLREGEILRVSSGCLVAFSDGVEFDVQMMQGVKNVIFGGEGLFVTTLTGPGTVWLQGQPPQRMISEIASRVPSGGGIGLGVPMGMGVGGGGGGADEGGGDDVGDTSGLAESGDDAEGLAASPGAFENDTAYTAASSTIGDESSPNTESQSALFGDAVEGSSNDTAPTATPNSNNDAAFASDDTSSFSTENDAGFSEDNDFSDETFSTHTDSS
eukprot:CAMPEP_0194286882 /NCGR_PEP_ID=MMETSP0169-20130528/33529_1 /TAXON_ID=218684 /ORGANISM="Corethron pennatum, Strain L29A3" /LENGTH=455 /DNA_ID=CAMNT_0039033423 /DNA_START=3 /DNA_END=1367 /DNA_ORIENTATION=+